MHKTEYVLWGSHPEYCDGQPIKIDGGTFRECERMLFARQRQDDRWELEICKRGEECSIGLPDDIHEYQDSIELSDIL